MAQFLNSGRRMTDRSRQHSGFASNRVYRGVARLFVGCHRHRRTLTVLLVAGAALPIIAFYIADAVFPFPLEKFQQPKSSVLVTDRTGRTMMELVGADGQRRQPVPLSELSPWLTKAVIAIEDQRFESHPGVDLWAASRAIHQNLSSQRTVSGASTITMQLCKMLDERPRTLLTKVVEAFRAIQLERHLDKDQILMEYLNLIPCGGNLRGVEAASQAYLHKSAKDLSLGEAALLAGLPQSPNRYAPDRHPDAALRRRETVLRQMLDLGMISQVQFDQARLEPLFANSRSVKQPQALHAAWMALARRPAGTSTTIDLDLQLDVESKLHERITALPEGCDSAIVVIDVASSEIVALVGSANESDPRDGQVNGATARRSPGSALKPFLYAAAFEAKRLNTESLVDDIPIERAGWSPENFDRTFRGAATAADALRQSLNVPAITITEGLGLSRCLGLLQAVGLDLPADAEERGGLAVATGGLEVTLLDLTNAYATLARDGIHRRPMLLTDETTTESVRVLDANVCRAVTAILSSEHRDPNGWESLPRTSRPWFAWKTGTSSGRRDAWAIGHNGRFAVGVWIGFFHGAGHREFVGRESAEPLLAELFRLPSIRSTTGAASYEPWHVERPLPRPVEASGKLTILSPRGNSTFLAWNGSTVIHPTASSRESITWFHNGRALTESEASRLIVSRGAHELRAVTSAGQSTAVQFTVK